MSESLKHKPEKITEADWIALCEGLEELAVLNLGSLITNGWFPGKRKAGIILTKPEITETGTYWFLSNDGKIAVCAISEYRGIE